MEAGLTSEGPLCPSASIEQVAGKLLRRVKSLLSSSKSSHTKLMSGGSDGMEDQVSTTLDKRGDETDSKESFHSFESMLDQQTPPRDEGLTDVSNKVNSVETVQLGDIIQLSIPCVDVTPSQSETILHIGDPMASFEEEMSLAMTTLNHSLRENNRSPAANTNAATTTLRRGSLRRSVYPGIMSAGRTPSPRNLKPLHVAGPMALKRDRGKCANKVRKDMSRKMKPRALGRITPADGSEDHGKVAEKKTSLNTVEEKQVVAGLYSGKITQSGLFEVH